MNPPPSSREVLRAVTDLAVGRPVDLHGWDADVAGATQLIAQVDFHRLGFQLVDAAGADYRRRTPAALGSGAAVIADFVRTTAVRKAFLRPLVDAALDLIATSLRDAAVPWAVVKGPALLAYGASDESRDFRDLDVLVTGDHLRPAVRALEQAGAVVLDRNFAMLERIVSGELSLGLPNGVVLDLHWHPVHSRFVRRVFTRDSAALVARAGAHHPDRFVHPVLDPHDNLVYVATHAGLTGGYRLLWIRDIGNALRHTDWDADIVVARARAEGVALVLAVVLDDVAALTGEPGAGVLADRLAPHSPWRWFMRVARWAEPLSHGKRPTWALARSTRASTAASVVELIGSRRSRLRGRDDDRNPWGSVARPGAEFREEVDLDARERYLEAVEREVRATTRG